MFLSDVDIKKAVGTKEIVLEPFDESRLQPRAMTSDSGNKFIVQRGE